MEEKKEGKLAGGPLGGLDAARLSMSAVSYGCLLKSGIPFLSGTQEVARFTIFRKRLESTYEYRFAKPPNGTPAYNPSFSQSRISTIIASTHMHILSWQSSGHTRRARAGIIIPLPFTSLINGKRTVFRCLLRHITNRLPNKTHATATHFGW